MSIATEEKGLDLTAIINNDELKVVSTQENNETIIDKNLSKVDGVKQAESSESSLPIDLSKPKSLQSVNQPSTPIDEHTTKEVVPVVAVKEPEIEVNSFPNSNVVDQRRIIGSSNMFLNRKNKVGNDVLSVFNSSVEDFMEMSNIKGTKVNLFNGYFEVLFTYVLLENNIRNVDILDKHPTLINHKQKFKVFIDINTAVENYKDNNISVGLKKYSDFNPKTNDQLISNCMTKMEDLSMSSSAKIDFNFINSNYLSYFTENSKLISLRKEIYKSTYNMELIIYMLNVLEMYSRPTQFIGSKVYVNPDWKTVSSNISFINPTNFNSVSNRITEKLSESKNMNKKYIFADHVGYKATVMFALMCLSNCMPIIMTSNNKMHLDSVFSFLEINTTNEIVIVTTQDKEARQFLNNFNPKEFQDLGMLSLVRKFVNDCVDCNSNNMEVDNHMSCNGMYSDNFYELKDKTFFSKLCIPNCMGLFKNNVDIGMRIDYYELDILTYEFMRKAKFEAIMNIIYDLTQQSLLDNTFSKNSISNNEVRRREDIFEYVYYMFGTDCNSTIFSNFLGISFFDTFDTNLKECFQILFNKFFIISCLNNSNEIVNSYNYSLFGCTHMEKSTEESVFQFFNGGTKVIIEKTNGVHSTRNLKTKQFIEIVSNNWNIGDNSNNVSISTTITTGQENFNINTDEQILDNYMFDQSIKNISIKMKSFKIINSIKIDKNKNLAQDIEMKVKNNKSYLEITEELNNKTTSNNNIERSKMNWPSIEKESNNLKIVEKPSVRIMQKTTCGTSTIEKLEKLSINSTIVTKDESIINAYKLTKKAFENGEITISKRNDYKITTDKTCVLDTIVFMKNKLRKNKNMTYGNYVKILKNKGINVSPDGSNPVNHKDLTRIMETEIMPMCSIVKDNNKNSIKLYNSIFCKFFVHSDYDMGHTDEYNLSDSNLEKLFKEIWKIAFNIKINDEYSTESVFELSMFMNYIMNKDESININEFETFVNTYLWAKLTSEETNQSKLKKEFETFMKMRYATTCGSIQLNKTKKRK